MVGLSLFFVYWLQRDPVSFLKIQKPNKEQRNYLLSIALFGAIFFILLAILSHLIGGFESQPPISGINDNRTVLFFVLPLLFLIASPSEELLFRGVIQSYIREISSAKTSIAISSFLFSIAHAPIYLLGQPLLAGMISMTVVVSLSILLGLLYEKSESLYVPMFLHSVYNSTIVFVFFLS